MNIMMMGKALLGFILLFCSVHLLILFYKKEKSEVKLRILITIILCAAVLLTTMQVLVK